MKRIKIRVLKKHIKAGLIGKCHFCPIALAIKAAGYTIRKQDYGVGCDLIGTKEWMADAPKKVARFVERFDSAYKVKPFEFTLRPEFN